MIPFPFKISLSSAVVLLAVVHFFGIPGLLFSASRPWFELATPVSLLISVLLLMYFHQDWNSYFIGFLAIAYLTGFGVEVVGVKTSMIFGSYEYRTTLGYKWLGVPLLIGFNWLMLTYATGALLATWQVPVVIRSGLAALLMTAMDYVIEPVAILHHYWYWHEAVIPLQNYLAWFVVSFALCFVFYTLPFHKTNPLAKYLLAIQLIFFLLLQLGHTLMN